MVRMRTIRECVLYFKENDPNTCIGESYLRHLVRFGGFPHIKSGNKYLINLDLLEKYLEGDYELKNNAV